MRENNLVVKKQTKCVKRDGQNSLEVSKLLVELHLQILINEEYLIETVCTPEYLEELVLGRLLTEGAIRAEDDVVELTFKEEQVANVTLEQISSPTMKCVKSIQISDGQIFSMADRMAEGMPLHKETWGAHSCFLYQDGELLFACEDIGRHNAMDKVIGYALMNNIELAKCALYTSGRVLCDMAEKAIRTGIPVLVSKGVPTKEAIYMAEKYSLTLICSARKDQMKVYTDFRKKEIDTLILAGGKSSRMGGKHKGNLELGGETFTQRLINEMSKVSNRVWISYGEDVHEIYEGCEVVRDIYKNCGPMGGIHAGLKMTASEIMFVVACDMPFMQAEFVEMLKQHVDEDTDIVVPVCNDKMQSSAAIYKKSVLPIVEKQLENGNYKLRSMFDKLKVSYVEIEDEHWKKMLQNINTLEEYKEIL